MKTTPVIRGRKIISQNADNSGHQGYITHRSTLKTVNLSISEVGSNLFVRGKNTNYEYITHTDAIVKYFTLHTLLPLYEIDTNIFMQNQLQKVRLPPSW
jgi:hypothetical protein